LAIIRIAERVGVKNYVQGLQYLDVLGAILNHAEFVEFVHDSYAQFQSMDISIVFWPPVQSGQLLRGAVVDLDTHLRNFCITDVASFTLATVGSLRLRDAAPPPATWPLGQP
jgi:hypothetical protein